MIYIQDGETSKMRHEKLYDNDVCFFEETEVWKEIVKMLTRFNHLMDRDGKDVHFDESLAAEIAIKHLKHKIMKGEI